MTYTRQRQQKVERGATFIIVIAVLSILVLLITALNYTMRLETMASGNFAGLIQARQAALAGLQAQSQWLREEHQYISTLQPWNSTSVSAALRVEEREKHYRKPPLSRVKIQDVSARVNVNTASIEQLERLFESVFATHGESGVSAARLAQEIVEQRYGADKRPGNAGQDDDLDSAQAPVSLSSQLQAETFAWRADGLDNDQDGLVDEDNEGMEYDGVDNDDDGVTDEADEATDEADEFVADPRIAPRGDDRPVASLAVLKELPALKSGRNAEEIFQQISPYLTVFSSSKEEYWINGEPVPRVHLNYASAKELYEAMHQYFPEKDETLLKQFVVNVVDWRDRDSIPTTFPGTEKPRPILGMERTPYINEVWSDSLTEAQDGDDGQYIELVNPYNEPLNVDGWVVKVGGTSVLLHGAISANGFLIITDDYNQENDPDPEDDIPDYGSFYDIFKLVPNNRDRRLIEATSLEIPDNSGRLFLYDSQHRLIDYFEYRGGVFSGIKRSFQRPDPRVRYAVKAPPTPFSANQGYSVRVRDREFFEQQPANCLFKSPAEILQLPSGFYSAETSSYRVWAYPELDAKASTEELDSRVVELVTTEARQGFTPLVTKLEELKGAEAKQWDEIYESYETAEVLGRLNLNTCSYHALMSLPEMTQELAQSIIDYREDFERRYAQEEAVGEAAFPTVSELFRVKSIWGGLDERKRIELMSKWWNQVGVNSYAFAIWSENTLAEKELEAKISCFALMDYAGDERRLVDFSFYP